MTRPSLAQLLEIENDPTFLDFRCPRSGALLWPLARNQFLRLLISDLYYQQAPLLTEAPPVPWGQAMLSLARVLGHNVIQSDIPGEILVMATGVGHFQRDGRWFNRITDYFVEESREKTVTVEGVVDWHIPSPRWNQRVVYWLPWQGAINIAGRLLRRDFHLELARDMLEYARQRAYDLLGVTVEDTRFEMLVNMLGRKLARLPVMSFAYRRLLEQVRPQLILLEQACYGDYSPLNRIAREMGIRVAEPQHGMVTAGHDAYCYAPILRDSSEYRLCLPHDFLGYGAWWNEQINVPVEKWVIGHPHYNEQRRSISFSTQTQGDVLLLSDGIEFPLYLMLAQELVKLLANRFRVVLRPHPLERAKIYRNYPDFRVGSVVIDANRDIYSSFASAYAVVGEVSTGLFEAVGIAGRVLIWETPKARFSYPQHPFFGFEDAQGLVNALDTDDQMKVQASEADFWADGWESNYQRYLANVLNAR